MQHTSSKESNPGQASELICRRAKPPETVSATFTEAIFEIYPEAELVVVMAGQPTAADCEAWNITGDEWRAAFEDALAAKRADAAAAKGALEADGQ